MRTRSIVLSLALAGVSLAACNKQTDQSPAAPATGAPIASLPLAQGAPPPLIAAPALAALPAAPPVQYSSAPPRERYRYIDRARALGAAFADSPPDYTIDYAGVRPWIWRSGRGEYRVVEPTPEGERTYYYDAGSDQPFLISDPQYSYGFSQGALTVVYAPDGRVVGYDPSAADRAARELARARALYQAAVHQQRQAAYAAAWRERREQVLAEQRAWDAEQQRDAEWRQWHDEHQRAEQADWDRERAMRAAYAATVAATIVSAVTSDHGHDRDQDRRPQNDNPPPPQGPPTFGQPGQPGGPGPNPRFQDRRDDHGQAQQQAQAEAARQQTDAARSAQAAAQADAARKAQLEAAQAAAARQQAQAAHAEQADAARKAQLASAQEAAARRQADAARSAQAAAQAEAARKGQAEAAQQAAARQQGEAARQAQLEAVRKAQAQGAQAEADRRQADAARAAQQAHNAQAQAQAAQQRQVQAAQQAQAAAKAQAQAQNPEAVKRGEQIKADMAKLAARKGDKPGNKKDQQNPQ